MRLSVIIPVYNERETIEEIVKKVQEVDIEKEIIIIDGASTDGTTEIVKGLSGENIIKLYQSQSIGKGSAVRWGIEVAKGDIIIIQDADLEYCPEDYHRLIEPIERGEADVVYGSRILGRNRFSYIRYLLGGLLLTALSNILYGAGITDEPTCYKAFKADVIKGLNLKCKRFEFCPEVTAKVRKAGFAIKEVPIRYYPRRIEEGKKISWKDGIEAIWTLIKYRFYD
jgi:glycosyltransferase involved in cell wall biosynthesis